MQSEASSRELVMRDLVGVVRHAGAILADEQPACRGQVFGTHHIPQGVHDKGRQIIHLPHILIGAGEQLPPGHTGASARFQTSCRKLLPQRFGRFTGLVG